MSRLCLGGVVTLSVSSAIWFISLYQCHALRIRQISHTTQEKKSKVAWMRSGLFLANSVKSYARLVIFFQPKVHYKQNKSVITSVLNYLKRKFVYLGEENNFYIAFVCRY